MSTYNSANVLTTLSGYGSSAWRTFGSDFASNPVTALTGRWTLTSRQQNSLAALNVDDKNYFNVWCNKVADELDNGGSVSFSGMDITSSGSGTHPDTEWTLHLD